MKKNLKTLAALACCIITTTVFTACNDVDDNPVSPIADGIIINGKNFPDPDFRSFLLGQDYGEDCVLTEAEIKNITQIDVSYSFIESLKGIEYFTALKRLGCEDCELTELDLSKNTALTFLDCSDNNLTSLNVSNNALLDSLDCCYNNLTELNVSKNTALRGLYCYENELTSLDLTKNTALEELDFEFNNITSIDLSNNVALKILYCAGNGITSLDVSKCTALEMLQCGPNKISGQNMDDLIGGLPQNTTSTLYKFNVIDTSYTKFTEENVCTKSQVAALKAKGWNPMQWDDDEYKWVDYPGSDD